MPAEANTLLFKINEFILNPLITVLFAFALVMFLWGVFQFVWQEDSDKARESGRNHMFYGLIGMFIMFSAFAIIRLIAGTLGVDVPDVLRGS